MCGIAGVWGDPDEDLLAAMTEALAHRGPDAAGTFVPLSGAGAFGHRRLSIVDPEGGDQPILDEHGARAIVANGEIYNAPILRPRLEERHRFGTRSDTEVALHLYEELGLGVVEQLDGMYALAIADGSRLVLARDHIGIKPLYYAEGDGLFLFASELKAFPTGTKDVKEFPPGTIWSSAAGFHTFYTVPDPDPCPGSEATHARRIRTALETAVTSHLMADVPIGAFLSGGLDSSALAAVMRPHVDELHTFTVGLAGSPDLEAARLVARHLDTVHHEEILSPAEVEAHLPQVVHGLESFDQDLVRSAVPTYFTARLAARHVKVVLTGEGADELFAGYRYHRRIRDHRKLRAELRRSVGALHNVNLQRVDRMTMAHALEARVPFLERRMIEVGLGVPVDLKLPQGGPEKRVLRLAVEDLLPAEVVWREKAQFDEGSGAADLLPALAAKAASDLDVGRYRRRHPEVSLRSAEECHYHRLLLSSFLDPAPLAGNVGRWTQRPAWVEAAGPS